MNFAQFILVAILRIYRVAISPVLTFVLTPLGFGCRFRPTCSRYAMEAIRTHGACRGALLAVRRICRCHPWGSSGYDPVPMTEPQTKYRNTETPKHRISVFRYFGTSVFLSGIWILGFGACLVFCVWRLAF